MSRPTASNVLLAVWALFLSGCAAYGVAEFALALGLGKSAAGTFAAIAAGSNIIMLDYWLTGR